MSDPAANAEVPLTVASVHYAPRCLRNCWEPGGHTPLPDSPALACWRLSNSLIADDM